MCIVPHNENPCCQDIIRLSNETIIIVIVKTTERIILLYWIIDIRPQVRTTAFKISFIAFIEDSVVSTVGLKIFLDQTCVGIFY